MSGFWTDAAVREALELPSGAGPAAAYRAVCTDTRKLEPGMLFLALRGERFDAHDFLDAAAERGAAGAVVERIPEGAPEGLVYYVVPDTLTALGRLARHYRRRLGASVLAIVGSNGKTTTKELARAVLGARCRVHATTGNLNNLIGTPLTILSAPSDAEVLVVELGTNAPGEIARLAGIVEADAVVVTAIAEEHLEGLGDLEGVLREETAILETLPAGAPVVVAEEPAMLPERARALASNVRVAGWTEAADATLRAEELRLDEEGRVRFRWAGREVELALRGRINARNALLALGIGLEWGVDPDAAVAALAAAAPAAMRGEFRRIGDLRVIADCYNSNPASLAAAVDLLASLPRRGGRVAVVGTMRELGEAEAGLHLEAAERIAGAGLDLIVATGAFVEAFVPYADRLRDRLICAEDPVDAYLPLARRLTGDEVVLLKGSRGVALERLLPRLEKDWGRPAAGAAEAKGDGEAAAPATGE